MKEMKRCLILSLPEEILCDILSYLTYDEVSNLRLVCKTMDKSCQRVLNQGFLKVEKYHAHCLKTVKMQLPRRESERRNHPLARHCEILTAVETRLSLLGMTFMKYIDMNLCCFIPGKVIDEIYVVLQFVQKTTNPPRAHEVLQELRDISSMAMEHFDEKIAPSLKLRIGSGSSQSLSSPRSYSSQGGSTSGYIGSSSLSSCNSNRNDVPRLNQYIKQLNNTNSQLRKELSEVKTKLNDCQLKIKEQESTLVGQNRTINEQGCRLSEQEAKLGDINKKLLKYQTLLSDVFKELVSNAPTDIPFNDPSPSFCKPMVDFLNSIKDDADGPSEVASSSKCEKRKHFSSDLAEPCSKVSKKCTLGDSL